MTSFLFAQVWPSDHDKIFFFLPTWIWSSYIFCEMRDFWQIFKYNALLPNPYINLKLWYGLQKESKYKNIELTENFWDKLNRFEIISTKLWQFCVISMKYFLWDLKIHKVFCQLGLLVWQLYWPLPPIPHWLYIINVRSTLVDLGGNPLKNH